MIHAWWDDRPEVEAGWYVERSDAEGNCVEDSEKVYFRVDTNLFRKSQEPELRKALLAEYPEEEIKINGN